MKKYTIGIFLAANPSYGGLFQYSLSVLDAMGSFAKEKEDIVAVYLDSVWERYINQYNIKSCCLREIPTRKIYATIHALNCDLMVYPSQLSEIYLSELVPDIPYVAMICDMNFYYDKEIYHVSAGFKKYTYISRLKRFENICRNAHGIFVDSLLGKKQVIRVCGESCADVIFVLPFCVPNYIQELANVQKSVSSLCVPLKYIFYPANFLEHKNQKNLILAVKLLKNKGFLVNLVLCGNPHSGFDYIQNLIINEGLEEQVTIFPYVNNEDLVYLYKNARAMIMPTLVGPTNIPPLEAMFLGCPVAVSDIGAMPEQVGNGGMTFDPYDIEDIAHTIQILWSDDRKCRKLIKNGYIQIKKFSSQIFKERLWANLLKCLDNINVYISHLKRMQNALRGKHVLCYGAGEFGYWISKGCRMLNIHLAAFLDAFSKDDMLLGIPIIHPKAYCGNREDTWVILSIDKKIQNEIKQALSEIGYRNFYSISWENEIFEIFYLLGRYPYNF